MNLYYPFTIFYTIEMDLITLVELLATIIILVLSWKGIKLYKKKKQIEQLLLHVMDAVKDRRLTRKELLQIVRDIEKLLEENKNE